MSAMQHTKKGKKLIVGNWKMNPVTQKDARTHFLSIKKELAALKYVQAVIAAPYVYMSELAKHVSSALALGAQDISAQKDGAFTGQISVGMVTQYKVKYVILGHSERRALGEDNALINQKIKQVLAKELTPIVCVGERERDEHMLYLGTVKTQLEECLTGISKNSVANIVIAYEPVWAISTTANRRDATPADFVEMSIYIKKVVADIAGHAIADSMQVLYGGSVDEKNALGFLIDGKADGLLPGHASLSPKKFVEILKIANAVKAYAQR
jgi:triosephosphate isomerase